MLSFNTIVIGAGPAGISASIYLKRAGINVLLLEKSIPGGLINMASDIENYPGFEKIDGPSLAMNMFSQLMNNNVDFRNEEVMGIQIIDSKKIVKTLKNEYECDNIIIASGRTPKRLNLPREKELTGRGVSLCALCDGNFFKGKDVAVVGGGNSALNEALYLANITNKVTLIHRRDDFRADQITIDKVKDHPNIDLILNAQVSELRDNGDKLTGIVIKQPEKTDELELDGLFIYVGYEPETKIIENTSITTDNGYIVVDHNYETNIKGIYAVGDAIKKEFYQIVSATGEGAQAAYHIIEKEK